MLLVFSVYAEDDRYDSEFLENYAKINLIPEVQRVPGVGDANVLGTDYSMRIWLKPDVMAQYKLSPSDVTVACLNRTLRPLRVRSANKEISLSNIRSAIKDVCKRLMSLSRLL